ncbi:MAG TPA: hypothetical protein VFK23_12085 [Nitrospirota bacterium]|nr:hypothetical protein [Nitrospirota bacterium]
MQRTEEFFAELRGNALVRFTEGEGHEHHLLFVAVRIVLMINGGGMWSSDQAIATRIGSGKQQTGK